MAQNSISINFWDASATNTGNNTVDSGETAGVQPIGGQFWNNISFPTGSISSPASEVMQSVIDNSGANAATFTSTLGSAFVGFTGISQAVPSNGDRHMMSSYLAWDNVDPVDMGTLTISGLGPAFTAGGYHVLLYSDNGDNTRTHTVTIGGQTKSIVDDATYDGLLNQANGFGGDNENYAVFEGLTASSFDIAMNSSLGRGAVNAIQIVAGAYVPPRPVLEINRTTGTIDLINETASALQIKGYTITSTRGALNQSAWKSIADNYDLGSGGPVDNDEEWIKFSNPNSSTDLSEGTFNGGSMATPSTLRLGNAGAWIGNPIEDLGIEILLEDGSIMPAMISFVGNGGSQISSADLDANGVVDSADWLKFRSNFNGPPLASTLSAAQLFQAGDRNGDFDVDRLDFLGFKQAFIAATSAEAFTLAVHSVPEPSSLQIVVLVGVLFLVVRDRLTYLRSRAANFYTCLSSRFDGRHLFGECAMKRVMTGLATICLLTMSADVRAVIVVSDDFNDGVIDTSQWVVVEQVAGQITESGGKLNLATATGNPRPYLATLDGWDPLDGAITFTGTVTLANNGSFALWTRSNGDFDSAGQPNAGGVIGSGVRVNFWLGGGATPLSVFTKEDTVWPWTNLTSTATVNQSNLSLVAGDWDVLVTDDGAAVSLTVTNVANPSNTGSIALNTTFSPAVTRNAIAFGNALASWDNIDIDVDSAPPLSLEVNTATGQVRMQNNSGDPVEIDYYEIRSAEGDLVASGGSPLGDYNGNGTTDLADYTVWRDNLGASDESMFAPGTGNGGGVDSTDYTAWKNNFGATGGGNGWLSFQDQDLEGSGAPGDGLGWEEGDNADSTLLFEAILDGGYTLATNADLDLGNAFSPGGAQTLTFEYHVAGTGATFKVGDVFYVNSASVGSVAIPEPSAFGLVLIAAIAGLVVSRRGRGTPTRQRHGAPMIAVATVALIVAWAVSGSAAQAAVYNDRVYLFGDSDSALGLEGTSNGAVIGSLNVSPLALDQTIDSGPTLGNPSGTRLQLAQTGGAVYQDVSPSGLNRPGAGSGDFGARFDGVDDYLAGIPVNRPDEMAELVNEAFGATYPLNYTNILVSGMQFWVYPEAETLGSVASPTQFQSIVFDTNFHGGPAINAIGQWTQSNSDHIDGAGAVPATVDVPAGDTWYHIMHHRYIASNTSGARLVAGTGAARDFTTVMYVDGVAVSANNDSVPLGTNRDLVVGAAELANDLFDHHFNGVVDDLEMYVYGDNTADGGLNYGTFNLFADNAWIADQIATDPNLQGTLTPGDANKDGSVNGTGFGNPATDDVAAFIAGWGSKNTFAATHNQVTAGDWLTWEKGDFNHDGLVDLRDWHLLTQNHSNGAGLSLGSLLYGSAVPEPNSIVVATLAATAIVALGRRRAGMHQ